MRRSARGLTALLVSTLAACADGPAEVQLVVTGDERTTRVELFVSTAGPLESRLQPASAQALVGGEVLARDPGEAGGPAAFAVDVDAARTARFVLRAGEEDRVRVAIAVGYDAQGALTGAEVMHDLDASKGLRVIVTLRPVTTGVIDAAPPSGELAALVWGARGVGEPTCVATREGDDTHFIVTADDPDCDGHVDGAAPDLECDPLVYQAEGATALTVQVVDQVCRPVRLSGCTDGATAPTAEVLPVCLPDLVCASACTADDLGPCLDGLFVEPLAYPRIVCDVPVTGASSASRTVCAEVSGFADLGSLFPDAPDGVSSITCQDVEVLALDAQQGVVSIGHDMVVAGRVGASVDVRATLRAFADTSACMLEVKPPAPETLLAEAPPRQVITFLTSANGSTGDRLVMPLVVKPVDCATYPGDGSIQCRFEPGGLAGTVDAITTCARTP